jgi:hypothetical protein
MADPDDLSGLTPRKLVSFVTVFWELAGSRYVLHESSPDRSDRISQARPVLSYRREDQRLTSLSDNDYHFSFVTI